MSIYKKEVNMSILLGEMAEDIKLLAPNLGLETNIAENLKVQGDRDLLAQVLQNLISNAIKYNLPNGWIKIQAYQEKKTVVIRVSNASLDIPASDREYLFYRFYRGDKVRSRQIEGIGLGLSLAREITRAHNGNLIIEPAILSQTTFLLTLLIK
ncbi:periplasmic sensor signal transduction histidine kinase [Calothrix sp. NIES-4101]|nr:periplasmic sensor signal transduction histidine kinase [Calothrix sp. NIES-4101]